MLGLRKSPWVIHYDASSCNGCDIETLACLTPLYDVERLGVVNTGNPKHADIFLVTGAVNEQSKSVIRNIYHQLPEPKVVVAIGACACTGGIFRSCYNISGGVDTVIPVDVYVPGCAARPEAIIDGVVKGIEVLEQKHRAMKAYAGNIDKVLVFRAEPDDAPEILALQKVAYSREAAIYGDSSLPALHQTASDLQKDFDQQVFLKAVVNGKIIGSIRGSAMNSTAHLSRMVVHPYFQGRGLGHRLVYDMESTFSKVKRYEAYTGHKSQRNLDTFCKLGYRTFKTEPFTPKITWVYLEKSRS